MVQPWLPWSIPNGELIHLITLWEICFSRSAQKTQRDGDEDFLILWSWISIFSCEIYIYIYICTMYTYNGESRI